MARVDGVSLRVYTYKEGVLSAVAHDLELDVTRFSVELSPDEVVVDIDASSLRVLHALKDGVPNRGALGRRDLAKIEQTIEREVLRARRFPRVVFRAPRPAASDASVTGELTLCGKDRGCTLHLSRTDTHLHARTRIHQPDFGIAPYTAMLGTLRIQADIDVVARVPLDALRDETSREA